eukprot:7366168-Lingulodinium_polyedra.AAC.1
MERVARTICDALRPRTVSHANAYRFACETVRVRVRNRTVSHANAFVSHASSHAKPSAFACET